MSILLIGGHGYIGSHVAIKLVSLGYDVITVDDHSNSNSDVAQRLSTIIGPMYGAKVLHHTFNVNPSSSSVAILTDLMKDCKVESVIHLAGLKSVGESVEKPLLYLAYNTELLYAVLAAMRNSQVKNILFSSTAALYGNGSREPLAEDSEIKCLNAYSESKFLQERILAQLAALGKINYTILRYFNPIGNHESGILGENPPSKPNNVLPFMLRCVGTGTPFKVFGNDYDTEDGTGVRDYIDVTDLADAHAEVIRQNVFENEVYNVGYGKGTSVLQLIKMVQNVVGEDNLTYEIGPRREGDIATCIANPNKFMNRFNWKPSSNVESAIKNHWEWEKLRRISPLQGG